MAPSTPLRVTLPHPQFLGCFCSVRGVSPWSTSRAQNSKVLMLCQSGQTAASSGSSNSGSPSMSTVPSSVITASIVKAQVGAVFVEHPEMQF
jgi:hypothetical protein